MGPDVWRFENEWPLARTRFTKYYIRSSGQANGDQGDGTLAPSPAQDEPPDRYVYDPADPVPTLGGQISTHGEIRGRKDRSSVQEREDILVYTSEPLERDMEVTGPVDFKLYAASSAVDTDWTATLSDLHPDGQAIHVCEGIRRGALPGFPGDSDADRTGEGLRVRHQLVGDQLRLQGGASDPPGNFQQQLSPVCPKSEHRRAAGDQRRDRGGRTDRPPQRAIPLPPGAPRDFHPGAGIDHRDRRMTHPRDAESGDRLAPFHEVRIGRDDPAEIRRSFEENGYLLFKGALNTQTVLRVRSDIADVLQRPGRHAGGLGRTAGEARRQRRRGRHGASLPAEIPLGADGLSGTPGDRRYRFRRKGAGRTVHRIPLLHAHRCSLPDTAPPGPLLPSRGFGQ